MRLKLDENVDARLGRILRDAGHDAATVRDQGLRGAPDPALYAHCISDGRMLVTLDLDFSNVIRYPPERTPGLIVLRGPNDLLPTVRMLSGLGDVASGLGDVASYDSLWKGTRCLLRLLASASRHAPGAPP